MKYLLCIELIDCQVNHHFDLDTPPASWYSRGNMNVETIKEYDRWAARGYVTALACPHHDHLSLIPSADPQGIKLICPMLDYISYLGLKDYRDIQAKNAMAQFLFESR